MAKLKAKRAKAVEHDHDYSMIFPKEAVEIEEAEEAEENIEKQKAYRKLKARFAHIRKLIYQKKYNNARYELTRINHPKAIEWLHKLNELDPTYSEKTIIVKTNLLVGFVMILALILIVVAFRAKLA